ncbi:MAG: flagellar biosynthesis protein FlhB [Peptococcaceae bacterium]|jgi:flagellar biosynthetic protein FlhB|nr:flagellar biosynthesis protein FlhB [Peptococcaceae bacterium]
MAGSAQEKTEQATPKRLQEARRKGQVAKSPDLTGAVCLLAIIGLLSAIKDQFAIDLQRYMTAYFSNVANLHSFNGNPLTLLGSGIIFALKLLAPFFGVAFLAAIIANIIQVGFMSSTEVLTPKLSHLNPLSGLQRMFSRRSAMELVKSILKFTLVGGLIYSLIKANLDELLMVLSLKPTSIYQVVMTFILKIAWWGALAFLALALFDYMYKRYDFNRSMKMSKQEVKEEFRQSEGDPQVKSRQREMRRRMSLNSIISEVPTSTVVVTNPTHVAVALLYKQGEMAAPKVVAKGADYLARRIREIARENSVPVVEDKELARFLYKNVDVDQEIPLEIYQAVAQVLAMVYRLKARENYRAV